MIYFEDGKVIAEHGDAKVYEYNDDLFLEIGPGHHLWALGSEINVYIEQLRDFPNGDVLEIGLGLGVVSRYILSFPKVNKLTTIEVNGDVIEVYKEIMKLDDVFVKNFGHKKHNIINKSGLEYVYTSDKKFDFIFLDFYDRIDEDVIPAIKDMVRGCKRLLKEEGKIMGWFDPYTPEEFVGEFYSIFEY